MWVSSSRCLVSPFLMLWVFHLRLVFCSAVFEVH
jgi:hypothetical protein